MSDGLNGLFLITSLVLLVIAAWGPVRRELEWACLALGVALSAIRSVWLFGYGWVTVTYGVVFGYALASGVTCWRERRSEERS